MEAVAQAGRQAALDRRCASYLRRPLRQRGASVSRGRSPAGLPCVGPSGCTRLGRRPVNPGRAALRRRLARDRLGVTAMRDSYRPPSSALAMCLSCLFLLQQRYFCIRLRTPTSPALTCNISDARRTKTIDVLPPQPSRDWAAPRKHTWRSGSSLPVLLGQIVRLLVGDDRLRPSASQLLACSGDDHSAIQLVRRYRPARKRRHIPAVSSIAAFTLGFGIDKTVATGFSMVVFAETLMLLFWLLGVGGGARSGQPTWAGNQNADQ